MNNFLILFISPLRQEPGHSKQQTTDRGNAPEGTIAIAEDKDTYKVTSYHSSATTNHHNEAHAHGINVGGEEFHWYGGNQTAYIA